MKKGSVLIFAFILSGFAAQAQTISDIKKVDFGNFTYQIGVSTIKMSDNLQVGACPRRRGKLPLGSIWNVVPENIAYGDLDGDGKAEAIVAIFANACGGTMITDEKILVYTLKNGRPTLLPEFSYIDEGCEKGKACDFSRSPVPLVKYDAKEKAIIVENQFQTEDDATCCPSLYRQTWYRWNGAKFVSFKKSDVMKREEQN